MAWIQPIADRFAAQIIASRGRWALLVAICTVIALVGLTRLDFDDDPRALYLGTDPDSTRLQALYDDFGPDDQDVLIVVKAKDVFSRDVLYAARELALASANVPGVDRVYSIFSLRRLGSDVVPLIARQDSSEAEMRAARQEALAHPLAAGHFVSSDATTMLIFVRLEGDPQTVSQLRTPVDEIRRLARQAEALAPMDIGVTGHPVLRVDILSALRRDQAIFVALSGTIAVVLALLLFRSLSATLIVVAAPTFGVLWIVGAMMLLGLRLNGLNTVLPTLVFVIGLTDAIHLMIELQRRLAAATSRNDAIQSTIRVLTAPCFLTSITTAIGFGSLGLASSPAIRQFGLACATGTILNFAAVIMVFPLLASTRLGDRLLPGSFRTPWMAQSFDLSLLMRLIQSCPKSIVVAGLATSVVLLVVSMQLRPDIRITEAIPTDSDSVVTLEDLDRSFGGGMYGYVVVSWPEAYRLNAPGLLEAVERVQAAIEAQPEFAGSFSVCNLLRANSNTQRLLHQKVGLLRDVPTPELRRLLRGDLRQLVVSFHQPNIGAAALAPALDRLAVSLHQVQSLYPGLQFQVTGTLTVAAGNLWKMVGDLKRSLMLSAALVFVVIGVSLRSWKLGLMSLATNLVPMLAAAAFLVICGQPLRLVSVLTFSLCLGIAVDDSIHFLTRFQRANRANGVGAAIEQAMREAGAGILTSTLILVGGFSVMLFSRMPSIQWFGLLCGVVMIAALCAVLVLLPALLLCFGFVAKPGPGPADRTRQVRPEARVPNFLADLGSRP